MSAYARRATAALLLAVAQAPAWATTWYVAPTSTAAKGTAAQPFTTIQAAANAAQPGDTISVAPGVYHETVTVTHSGTAAAPITFMSQQTGAAVVSGADPVGALSGGGASGSWTTGAVATFSSGMAQDEQCFAGHTRLPIARWPATTGDALSSPVSALVKSVANASALGYDSLTQMWVVQVTATLDRTLPAGTWVNALVEMNVGGSYDQVSGAVTAQGTATDGSGVLTIIYYTPSALLAAGNETEHAAKFGQG